jgi:hypothetical protein
MLCWCGQRVWRSGADTGLNRHMKLKSVRTFVFMYYLKAVLFTAAMYGVRLWQMCLATQVSGRLAWI